MSINQARFAEFREEIRHLGDQVQPVRGLTDTERVQCAQQE
ncbi:MAG: hypothetical protein U1F76_30035 [Candidatus Competibacteraceae bacterium]